MELVLDVENTVTNRDGKMHLDPFEPTNSLVMVGMITEDNTEVHVTFDHSEKPNTLAQRKYKDDVDEKIKSKRLTEIITLQQKHSLHNNKKHVGSIKEVLVEGYSKKSKDFLYGRTTQNTVAVFPKEDIKIGDLVNIKINDCTSATLLGNKY